MIHVVAVITAKPGQREAILRHFHANVLAVKAEQGCIEYGAVIDAGDALPFQTKAGPDTFLVIEKWASMDALAALFDTDGYERGRAPSPDATAMGEVAPAGFVMFVPRSGMASTRSRSRLIMTPPSSPAVASQTRCFAKSR